ENGDQAYFHHDISPCAAKYAAIRRLSIVTEKSRSRARPAFRMSMSGRAVATAVSIEPWATNAAGRAGLHRAHGQLQDLAVREVVHGRIVEMEAVGEALLVVGHEGEAEIAVLGAAELFHAR